MHKDSTVFFLDDDAAVRDAISISLDMAGFKTEVYASGKAFLEAYTSDRPGCVLMNAVLPDMHGLAVLQELHRRRFSIPVIFMPGIETIQNLLTTLQSSAFCILENPFSRQLLIECIRQAMEHDCQNRSTLKLTDTQEKSQSHEKRLLSAIPNGLELAWPGCANINLKIAAVIPGTFSKATIEIDAIWNLAFL